MSITSANAVYLLTIPGIFSVAQPLQQFAADDAFDTDAIEPAEVQMGVDGIMTAGWVPVPTKQTITLMADSTSALIFDSWNAAQAANRTIFYATGIITLMSTGQEFNLINGVLTSYVSVPPARKVLQPRKFGITWQTVLPVPINQQ